MQIIFQDPHGSLDPRMTVRQLIGEGLVVHGVSAVTSVTHGSSSSIDVVGLRREHLDRYPHEFSGGQRQRIGIARALATAARNSCVADEPVSALDVSVQSQVLNLLSDLQREFGLTYLFIAHDLSVVEYLSDRVGVMYLGQLVELGERGGALCRSAHALHAGAALRDPGQRAHRAGRKRIILHGDVPSPLNPPSGCPFRTRCWMAQDVCAEARPPLREVRPDHFAACHFAD